MMTRIDHLVIMSRWTYDNVKQALEQLEGPLDPTDPRGRKRRLIVRAATELFLDQGFRKTTIDDVARRACVAKGTVYLYVRTKGELLVHAIVEEKKRYLDRARALLDPGLDPRARIKLWIRLALVMSQEMPLVSRVIGGERELLAALQDLPEDLLQRSEQMKAEFVSSLLDEAARPHGWTPSELQDRTVVLTSLIYLAGLLQDPRVLGGLPLERFAEILAEMIVDGLGPRGALPLPLAGRRGAPRAPGKDGRKKRSRSRPAGGVA